MGGSPSISSPGPSRPSLFGYALKKLNVPDLERNITVVAWNTVIYGVLMLVADMYGRQEKTINDVTLKSAFFIGWRRRLPSFPAPAVPASP